MQVGTPPDNDLAADSLLDDLTLPGTVLSCTIDPIFDLVQLLPDLVGREYLHLEVENILGGCTRRQIFRCMALGISVMAMFAVFVLFFLLFLLLH